ncbi:MAG: MG2 domain-containing protein [Saprospiraceae bacterium]
MITRFKQNRLLLLSLMGAFAVGAFFLVRNQRIVKNEAYFEAVSKYIYAFSSGAIGREDAIRVRFVNAAVGKDQVGQAVSESIFSITPAIAGTAVWEDDRTIKLQPDAPLPAGKRYTGRVRLSSIYGDVPSIARTFEFDFNVRAMACEVLADGIQTDQYDPHLQKITGRVRINEPVAGDQVEKMFKAKQGVKALLVNWVHSENGQTHEFVVTGVERGNVRSSVQMYWDGAPIGLSQTGKLEQIVAALDEFVVLNVQSLQVDEQYVLINFSDPVTPDQDLAGLIRIEGYSGGLRYVVDGNFVRVYPSTRLSGPLKLLVESGIRNKAGMALNNGGSWNLNFEELKPAVRLVGRGAIIPQNANGGVIFPFEAVGLNSVDIEIFKIFNSNILQYLQVNELEGEQELERVGKIVRQQKISLRDLDPEADTRNWQRYALDLKDMIKQDPGAIYQVRIAFRRGYTDLSCATNQKVDEATGKAEDEDDLSHIGKRDDDGNLVSIMGGYRGIYWADTDPWWYGEEGDDAPEGGYNWSQRETPCEKEYYFSERFAQRNVFVSDLGMTAKRGKDGSLFLAVTDLLTAQPVSGIDLELFNYQLQSITKVRTNATGTVMIENLRETPFVTVASGANRRGYLRMADGNTLSLSRFDVAGVEAQKGIKGYIYGERGVWRPGDSLFLNFVLEDKGGKLPADHPVTLELTDPRGALQYRTVQTQSVGGVYPLHCVTRAEAPTGNWTAKVLVGGATFTQNLKIETVKPNRLKMDLNFGKKQFNSTDEALTGKLAVTWLHGAVAKNLNTKVEMQVRAVKTEFKNFKDFVFDDPARSFYSDPQVLFEGEVDQAGLANVPLALGEIAEPPGKLVANLKVRAFEKSGDFSTDNFSMDYFPYERFVGVSIPTGQWGQKTISARGGIVRFACVDANGKPQAGKKLSVRLFRCDWRWWWDEDASSNVAQFNAAENVNALDAGTVTTDANGVAAWKIKPDDSWGRFFVRVLDEAGGHAAGDFFWRGYPDQLDDIKSRNAAAMLAFSVEKEKYTVGEEVTLKVPASESGRILLTLENGSRVVQHVWFDAKTGDNFLKFKTTELMAPTIYAHVSLMQPHAQTKNDLPIRMYGVMPVNVENPQTHLNPQIEMPDVLKPGENFNVAVRETGGKACTYTLAIVDEGLLDLTRFKTPNPWDAFFAREALGVKTWDIYDYVLGAYGAELERILAIGGDGINQKAKNAAQVNRFKPAVIHLGPFKLEKGQTARHNLKLDNYVGSVRVMVVCSAPASGGNGAYGSAEKTCPVRKPLMLLPTLPRVLGPGETLRLPVDVFAMEAKVNSATISVREKSGLVSIGGAGTNTLTFKEPGEAMTYFELKVGNKTGVAQFTITGQGGGETTTQDIEILVRNPNPMVSRVVEGVIEPGKTWSPGSDIAEFTEVENAVVEISTIPPINLSKQLEYLIQYPHGCIEQTTSAAFPQLYVDLIAPLTDKQKRSVQKNIEGGIQRLQDFQLANGGFSYWPGSNEISEWGCNYAGHFLLEAKARGFAVPKSMLDRWVEYQTKLSRIWEAKQDNGQPWEINDHNLNQAYRLYTLALAGKADMAGMNRLRERKQKYDNAVSLLAAAYAMAGKPEAARDLLNDATVTAYNYEWWGHTYGSTFRDQALRLETYTAVGDTKRATELAQRIAGNLGNTNQWYSTQELATGLRAICKYAQKNSMGEKPEFSIKTGNGAELAVNSNLPYYLYNFTEKSSSGVSVRNTSKARLYARVLYVGRPSIGSQVASASNVNLAIRYTDIKGMPIDVAKINQGTDFIAEVTVSRNSAFKFNFDELALTQVFPSGWEILNTRMNLVGGASSDPVDYQDVRDDRVLTYFDLPYNSSGGANVKQSRTYRIQLNAAYAGRYYLPTASCEAMYDNRISANVPGKWVEVQ